MLQVSACYVYLTSPFVLSWRCIEAVSAGCLVVGSATPPVREVVEHGANGLLVDFFDIGGWIDTVSDCLANPEKYSALRDAAQQPAHGLADSSVDSVIFTAIPTRSTRGSMRTMSP